MSTIDGKTGKVVVNREALFTQDNEEKVICPGISGGKNWPAGAYSPQTNTMYMPLENLCSVVTSAGPKTGKGQLGMKIDYTAKLAPGETNVGQVRAISVKTGATAWSYNQRAGVMAVVATGGGLVFGGDATGGFRALDAKTGDVRWQTQLGGVGVGYPDQLRRRRQAVRRRHDGHITGIRRPRAHVAGAQGGQRARPARLRGELIRILERRVPRIRPLNHGTMGWIDATVRGASTMRESCGYVAR